MRNRLIGGTLATALMLTGCGASSRSSNPETSTSTINHRQAVLLGQSAINAYADGGLTKGTTATYYPSNNRLQLVRTVGNTQYIARIDVDPSVTALDLKRGKGINDRAIKTVLLNTADIRRSHGDLSGPFATDSEYYADTSGWVNVHDNGGQANLPDVPTDFWPELIEVK